MKTTLSLDVEYDPRQTDPESLASAMDRLLETALSTPDILDEYGNPVIGEFLVAEAEGQVEAGTSSSTRPASQAQPQVYALRIGGPILREQVQLLLSLPEGATGSAPLAPKTGKEKDLLEGILSLLEEIADQAHDRYGIDCLLHEEPEPEFGRQ